ncbi:MAG: hypothetical protein AAF438_11820 [Pseudomonadota bacterium]
MNSNLETLEKHENPYLADCGALAVWHRTLYVTSASNDCVLGFDLQDNRFNWAMQVQRKNFKYKAMLFNPCKDEGPLGINKLGINNVSCFTGGMHISGEHTQGLLHYNGEKIRMSVELPFGSYNAKAFRNGVLFNDSLAGALRYSSRIETEDRARPVPGFERKTCVQEGLSRELTPFPGFARGLAALSDSIVVSGVSPATLLVHELQSNETIGSVTLSQNASEVIHSITPVL